MRIETHTRLMASEALVTKFTQHQEGDQYLTREAIRKSYIFSTSIISKPRLYFMVTYGLVIYSTVTDLSCFHCDARNLTECLEIGESKPCLDSQQSCMVSIMLQ